MNLIINFSKLPILVQNLFKGWILYNPRVRVFFEDYGTGDDVILHISSYSWHNFINSRGFATDFLS